MTVVSSESQDDKLTALDILYGLVLESGDTWGERAEQFQIDDAHAILGASPKPASYLTRARGGSKSTDIAGICIGWLVAEAPPRMHSYVVAVAEEQSLEVLDAAEGLIARTPGLSDYVLCESSTLFAANGATVHVLTSDGSSAWGKGRDTGFIILDEFAQWPETRRYRKLWVAMLTATQKTPGLRLIILTSAGEPGHFSYDVLTEAKEGLTKDFWHVGELAGKIPWVTEASLEFQRPHLTESEFRRLHYNEWTEDEDRLITEEEWKAAAVLSGPLDPVRGTHYAIFCDIGVKVDPTVIAVAHTEKIAGDPRAKRLVIDRLDRFVPKKKREVNLTQIETHLDNVSRQYFKAPIYGDPSQFIQMRQNLALRGRKVKEFKFTPTSVGELGSGLVQLLENGQLWCPDTPELKAELLHVRLRQTSPGVYRLEHDKTGHDDQAVVLGMAGSVLLGRGVGTTSAFREYMEREKERAEAEARNPVTGDPSASKGILDVQRHLRGIENRRARGSQRQLRARQRCQHMWRNAAPHDCVYGCGATDPNAIDAGTVMAPPDTRFTDLRVRTANPKALDETMQQLAAAVVVDGSWDGDTCIVRVFGDPGFVRFAITQQGYGEIVE